jgi:YHS domain-containing protein
VSVLAEIIQVRGSRAKPAVEPKKNALPVLNKEAKDPVCGMRVDVIGAKYKSEHNGSTVYFCCAGCKQSFDRQPEKYALAVCVKNEPVKCRRTRHSLLLGTRSLNPCQILSDCQ